MSNKPNQNLFIGAVVVAGVLGTLTSLLMPKKSYKSLTDQAKDLAHDVFDKKESFNKQLLLGSVAGGIVGVTTALLLAPKPGSELIKDIYDPFHEKHPSHTKKKSLKKTGKQVLKKVVKAAKIQVTKAKKVSKKLKKDSKKTHAAHATHTTHAHDHTQAAGTDKKET